MDKSTDHADKISAGERASIENTGTAPLSISLSNESGCEFQLDLLPGQVVGFAPGELEATVILHKGDPARLLIIKPETAT